jgi:hypothetical protein
VGSSEHALQTTSCESSARPPTPNRNNFRFLTAITINPIVVLTVHTPYGARDLHCPGVGVAREAGPGRRLHPQTRSSQHAQTEREKAHAAATLDGGVTRGLIVRPTRPVRPRTGTGHGTARLTRFSGPSGRVPILRKPTSACPQVAAWKSCAKGLTSPTVFMHERTLTGYGTVIYCSSTGIDVHTGIYEGPPAELAWFDVHTTEHAQAPHDDCR